MEIKVLGTGCCSKCATLTKNAEEAVKTMGGSPVASEVAEGLEPSWSYGAQRRKTSLTA